MTSVSTPGRTPDANFNVTAIIATDGTVQERYIYDPYGARTILDADWSADADGVSDFGWVHGHQGLAEDPETGLVQNRERVYIVNFGRFLQRDGRYTDGMDLYEYVGSNPASAVDPIGLKLTLVAAGSGDKAVDTKTTADAQSVVASYRLSIQRALQKLDDFGEQRFKAVRENGSVLFAGKPFPGGFKEFRQAIERELDSQSFVYVDSDELGKFVDFAVEKASTHDKDYDELLVVIHGVLDDYTLRFTNVVRLNGKHYPQDDALRTVKERLTKAGRRHRVASCGQDKKNFEIVTIPQFAATDYRFAFSNKEAQKCSVHFNPKKFDIQKAPPQGPLPEPS